eukprot:1159748-Pelagomonas_calceolata.AAC.3
MSLSLQQDLRLCFHHTLPCLRVSVPGKVHAQDYSPCKQYSTVQYMQRRGMNQRGKRYCWSSFLNAASTEEAHSQMHCTESGEQQIATALPRPIYICVTAPTLGLAHP